MTDTCKNCNKPLVPNARFCKHCGKATDRTEKPSEEPVCPVCGKTNAPGATFCRYDGTELTASAASGMAHTQRPTREKERSVNKRPTKIIAIGIGSAILIALAAGLFGLYWMGYVGDRPEEVAEAIMEDLNDSETTNVMVQVNRDWTAELTGSVEGRQEHQDLIREVSQYPSLEQVVDRVEVIPDRQDISDDVTLEIRKRSLDGITASVDSEKNVTLSGTRESNAEISDLTAWIETQKGVSRVFDDTKPSLTLLQSNLDIVLSDNEFENVQGEVLPDNRIALTGIVNGTEQRNVLLATIENGFPGFHVDSNVGIVKSETPKPRVAAAKPKPAVQIKTGPVGAKILGEWHGRINGRLLSYDVVIEITDTTVGKPSGRTIYTQSGNYKVLCTGKLILESLTSSVALFSETVDEKFRRLLNCPTRPFLKYVQEREGQGMVTWYRKKDSKRASYQGSISLVE